MPVATTYDVWLRSPDPTAAIQTKSIPVQAITMNEAHHLAVEIAKLNHMILVSVERRKGDDGNG